MMMYGRCWMRDAGCKMEVSKELLVHTSVKKHQPSSILHPAFSTPTKNDVLIGPEYAVWSPGQDPNDQVINWYYDDVPTVGGYNHFELRRYLRAYDLPNPTGGDNFFNKRDWDDPAPPMGAAAVWLDTEVFL